MCGAPIILPSADDRVEAKMPALINMADQAICFITRLLVTNSDCGRTDANTTASFIGGTYSSAYYYYDDVKIIALCTNVPVKTVACAAPWNFDPAPLAVDRCSGSKKEISSLHSITSVARKRISFGILMPIALAALRLTTRAKIAACSIGRSPGLAPFRIRSTNEAARLKSSA